MTKIGKIYGGALYELRSMKRAWRAPRKRQPGC